PDTPRPRRPGRRVCRVVSGSHPTLFREANAWCKCLYVQADRECRVSGAQLGGGPLPKGRLLSPNGQGEVREWVIPLRHAPDTRHVTGRFVEAKAAKGATSAATVGWS